MDTDSEPPVVAPAPAPAPAAVPAPAPAPPTHTNHAEQSKRACSQSMDTSDTASTACPLDWKCAQVAHRPEWEHASAPSPVHHTHSHPHHLPRLMRPSPTPTPAPRHTLVVTCGHCGRGGGGPWTSSQGVLHGHRGHHGCHVRDARAHDLGRCRTPRPPRNRWGEHTTHSQQPQQPQPTAQPPPHTITH